MKSSREAFLFIAVFRFEIIREGILAKVGSKRAVNRILKQLNKELAEHWHTSILPRHWDAGAPARYGYKPRTEKYRKRKKSLFLRGRAESPDTDLLLSGLMEESVTEYGSIRAFPTRFSVDMHGPRYVSMRPYKSGHPNMGEEITALSPDEDRELAALASKRLPQLIQAERGRKRERVG